MNDNGTGTAIQYVREKVNRYDKTVVFFMGALVTVLTVYLSADSVLDKVVRKTPTIQEMRLAQAVGEEKVRVLELGVASLKVDMKEGFLELKEIMHGWERPPRR